MPNNSPDALPSVWLQIDQNIYSRRFPSSPRAVGSEKSSPTPHRGCDQVDIASEHEADYAVSDTACRSACRKP